MLPDKTTFSENGDLARFTDPERSAFWIGEDPDSPAYQE
jgi:hypothetical protein